SAAEPPHAPARSPHRPQGQSNSIISRDAIECERQDQLARPRRPAERGFRVAHPFAGTDDPPQYVRKPWSGGGGRPIEAAPRVELSAVEVYPNRRSASPPSDRRRIPCHRHAGCELSPLPVTAKPLAGIELAAGHMTVRKQPAERGFGRVDG